MEGERSWIKERTKQIKTYSLPYGLLLGFCRFEAAAVKLNRGGFWEPPIGELVLSLRLTLATCPSSVSPFTACGDFQHRDLSDTVPSSFLAPLLFN